MSGKIIVVLLIVVAACMWFSAAVSLAFGDIWGGIYLCIGTGALVMALKQRKKNKQDEE